MDKLRECPFCGGEAEIEDWDIAYESGTTGWEWIEDVYACSKGGIYRRKKEGKL